MISYNTPLFAYSYPGLTYNGTVLTTEPIIDELIFKIPPKPKVWWDNQRIQRHLGNGTLAQYRKGFTLRGILEWRDSWIKQGDYSNIALLYTTPTGTAEFWPTPLKRFHVVVTNDFNFIPHGGDLRGRQIYEGSIVFESSKGEITSTAVEIF